MKIFSSSQHTLPGAITYGRESHLRVNQVFMAADDKPVFDPLHYHKQSIQTFVITEGTLIIEVEGKEIELTRDQILQIEPGEKYRTLKHIGDARWVVVGTHNQEGDRVSASED